MLKKISQGIFIFCLSLMTIGLFLPMTSLAKEEDPVYQKIETKKKLVVGLTADYPPYEFHAKVKGKDTVVGSDILLAEKIAKELGVELEIRELSFDALLGSMKTGKIDMIISAMTPTPEREKEAAFSDPYLIIDQKVVVLKKDQDKYLTTEDFSGQKVAAQKQSIQEDLAKKELTGSTVVSLPKVTDMIMQLQTQKIAGAVMEAPVAEAYVYQNKALAVSDVKFKDDKPGGSCIAMPKEATALLPKVNNIVKEVNDQDLMTKYNKQVSGYMFEDESFFKKYGSFYAKGIGYTIFLAFIGVLFGAVLGVLLALMKLSKLKVLKAIAVIYIEYVRGTPLLVQIFLVYFGTATLGLNVNALAAGCIAMSLNSGAYVAEIVRAGIKAVDKGQYEAARSLGMNHGKAMQHIILPQAIKNILPALGNEFVTVIKESSVVSVIGVSELMFQAGVVQGASFKPFLPIVVVSLIYFALTFTLSRLLGLAERRMSTSD
ncbi:ABC transporter substrate-binding protein/permease [Vagococcus humatus]|uniref:ABC transporter permease n=1 Tax=Vagococcus humatus TaxID=1889241 RepID=A0A429Z8K8_9ENTE|nr:ABC transporter substrate-binding protein/permease [Vagococcus humatus]RST90024.1 ABC transporter permease [Vagococcus humatus]